MNLFSLYAVNFSDHVTAFTKEKYGLILIYTESRCKKESNITSYIEARMI